VLRGEATGAPATFQAVVMEGGAFRNDVKLQDSYVNVTKAVAADPAAISFAGTMYILRGVRTVPVAIEKDQPFIGVDSPEADAGQYPLVRPQHMVVNYDSASKPLTDIQQEFMKYVFSQMGQEDVIKAGFAPVAAAPAKIALERVGLHTFN
jgi:phosphate transport system substrate-binding protein